MDKQRILLVEDDENLGYVIQDLLSMNGYKVHLARDGKEGLLFFNKSKYDLCLIDVMMPKKDGFELAEDIQKVNNCVPLVFLTARNQKEDKIKGLKLGADDYITKPFDSDEFLLRVKAILRRSSTKKNNSDKEYKIGEYTFTPSTLILSKDTNNRRLTKKESALLKLLCEHKGKILEREVVSNLIWGDDSYFVGRSMDVFITRLRKYLKDDSAISITNIHGVGFRLEER
ncbi:MAG: response regulator transcription factor [Flavobacteriales bacterium]|jgi:DNA-binding response OmpR family regulator|tara:strand:- start:2623 stop:3309 length:687 start_codon:yes stop_codon:yes gene_type:complete